MGSSTSKPTDAQHYFTADHPVRFSEGLVNTLQNNPETDSSRAKNLELIIQQRVTAELQKHLEQADSKFTSLSESISSETHDTTSHSSSGPSLTEKPLLTRLSEKITGTSSESAQAPQGSTKSSGPDSTVVAKDLEELRKKLQARKSIAEKDAGIEQAKDSLISCLKTNDRRPLDCWQEVEKFKAEVGRLERAFVDRNAA